MMLPSKATRKHREKALFNSRVLSKFCNLLYMCTTDYRLLYMSYVLNEIWTVLQTAFGMLCKVIWLKILVEANLEGRDVGKEEKRKRKIALKKAPNRQKEFPSPYSCRNRVHSEPDDQMTVLYKHLLWSKGYKAVSLHSYLHSVLTSLQLITSLHLSIQPQNLPFSCTNTCLWYCVCWINEITGVKNQNRKQPHTKKCSLERS